MDGKEGFGARWAIGAVLVATACGSSGSNREAARQRTALVGVPASSAAPSSDDALDVPGSHDGDWVECPHRRVHLASDPLGPIVAHGLREAPGYRRGMLSRPQARAFAASRLHLDVDAVRARVVYERVALPSALPGDDVLARLAAGALELAGRRAPAVPGRIEMHEDAGSVHTRRSWTIRFLHDGVPVTGARCEISVQAGDVAPAMLDCRVPVTTETPAFEPFRTSRAEALRLADQALGRHAVRADAARVYHMDGGVGRARWQVVAFDGRHEGSVVLSGDGEVLAKGSNEKGFTFAGYDLDSYNTGQDNPAAKSGPVVESTPVPVGVFQTDYLDSAPLDEGQPNCSTSANPATPPAGYSHGFVVCHNGLLPAAIPLAKPRPDGDFTNAADATDPLGVQEHFLSSQLSPAVTLNGGYALPAVPVGDPQVFSTVYVHSDTATMAQQPIAPVHDAELQAFYDVGKLQDFYALLLGPSFPGCNPASPGCQPDFTNAYVDADGQDHLRLEISVHHAGEYNASHGSRYFLDVEDNAAVGSGTPASAVDGTLDGFVVAHEYQHHVQERLAQIEGWQVRPFDPGITFNQDADSRRRLALEGIADGFGALAVRRARGGTLLDAHAIPDPCADDQHYPDAVQGAAQGRPLCNTTTFGFWANENVRFQCALDPTHPYSERRRELLGAALWGYERWFVDAGITSATPGKHLTEAERALGDASDGEIDFLDALVTYLRSLPDVADQRYVHLARTAFAEKGIFLPVVHQNFTPPGLDYRDHYFDPSCRAAAGCTPTQLLALALGSLTVAAPITWPEDGGTPEVAGFAPFVYTVPVAELDLSNRPDFPPSGGGAVTTTETIKPPTLPYNCSPPGFFRQAPSGTDWTSVASAAVAGPEVLPDGSVQEPRVYYRLRLCASAGSSDCISSIGAANEIPAYAVIQPAGGGGCTLTCAVPARRGRAPWAPGAAAGLAGLLLLRRRRRT